MNLEEIKQYVKEIREKIFDYEIDDLPKYIIEVFEKLQHIEKNFNDEEKKVFHDIIEYIQLGLENKDFLVVADILFYELIVFIENHEKRR